MLTNYYIWGGLLTDQLESKQTKLARQIKLFCQRAPKFSEKINTYHHHRTLGPTSSHFTWPLSPFPWHLPSLKGDVNQSRAEIKILLKNSSALFASSNSGPFELENNKILLSSGTLYPSCAGSNKTKQHTLCCGLSFPHFCLMHLCLVCMHRAPNQNRTDLFYD